MSQACYVILPAMTDNCHGQLHPQAVEGILLFNSCKYFEAHEALERAWLEEKGEIRNLYRGILQIAVTYLHITRGNYNGAVKVYGRSLKWMKGWPEICRGIQVGKLRFDAGMVIEEVMRLGKEKISSLDRSLLKPIEMDRTNKKRVYICGRCGHEMIEKNCKVVCPNCGNRFDCSDLNLYFD